MSSRRTREKVGKAEMSQSQFTTMNFNAFDLRFIKFILIRKKYNCIDCFEPLNHVQAAGKVQKTRNTKKI